jgi:RecJ-like exonuclease
MTLAELMSKPGNIGKFTGQVIDIYFMKSANITLFTLIDSSGKKVQGAVHSSDGFKSYPNITNSNVVQIVARYKVINEQDRLQIFSIDKVKQHEAFEFFDELAAINIQTGGSVDETTFFIESSLYDQLKPSFVKAANRIRIATLRNQNIITRYHSPCVDGVCGAYAIDFGIKKFVEAKGTNPQEFKRNIRRIPQRNSTLEVREVVRDLSFATDDGFNTRNLPLYVLVDVGSDEESKAALAICKSYGVDVVIVDTHAVAEGNEELAQSFINPSKLNTEEKVTTAMLSVELAKFISPETDVSSNLLQLSVISGLADDVSGTEYGKYLEIVEQNEYDLNRLGNILSALDYVIFGLRHFDGGQIVRDLLGINLNHERTTELIEGIAPTSKSLFSIAVKSAQANVEKSVLGDDKTLVVLDIDNFASKYEYPSHSSIISAIHSAAAEEESGTVITLGLSEDYLLIKNSALDFDFTEFLTQLQEELLNVGISGNGQNQSGSIQYLSGFKDQVFETMKNFLK